MNLHDGPTGQAIRDDRNHRINQSNRDQKRYRKQRALRFPKLKGCPNPIAHRMAIWRARNGVTI